MTFDPYLSILANFSKQKFKKYVEAAILDASNYAFDDFVRVNRDAWTGGDFAEVMPPDLPGPSMWWVCPKWVFALDYHPNEFLKQSAIYDKARQRIILLARQLVQNTRFVTDLVTRTESPSKYPFLDPPLLMPNNGIQFYYLTNVAFTPSGAPLDAYTEQTGQELIEIISEIPKLHGGDFSRCNFSGANITLGWGTPSVFLTQQRDKAEAIVREIERRPDAVNISLHEGSFRVEFTNSRSIAPCGSREPRIVLLEELIDPESYFLSAEVAEFEHLLNKRNVREADLQVFFESHPHFLKVLDYDEVRSQVVLRDDAGEMLIPDFMLKPLGKQTWDVLDIKAPDVKLLAGPRNRLRLSQCVHDGISQLMHYAAYFDSPANRNRLYKSCGIYCSNPKLTLVIGSKGNIDESSWNRVIAFERPAVNIVSYDELLRKINRYRLKL